MQHEGTLTMLVRNRSTQLATEHDARGKTAELESLELRSASRRRSRPATAWRSLRRSVILIVAASLARGRSKHESTLPRCFSPRQTAYRHLAAELGSSSSHQINVDLGEIILVSWWDFLWSVSFRFRPLGGDTLPGKVNQLRSIAISFIILWCISTMIVSVRAHSSGTLGGL